MRSLREETVVWYKKLMLRQRDSMMMFGFRIHQQTIFLLDFSPEEHWKEGRGQGWG